jgi:hypothetical protein
MKITLFTSLPVRKTLLNRDINGRIINIYCITDVVVTGINMYYPNTLLHSTDHSLILPLLEQSMSLKSGSIYYKYNMEYTPDTHITNFYDDALFFFIYDTDNYYHFIYDTLPYIISYIAIKKDIPNIKLLMQYPNAQKHKMYRFVLEFLELLGVTRDDIVIVNGCTQYKTVYISTSYTHDIDSNLPPRTEIFDMYNMIVGKIKNIPLPISMPSKMYISRRSWIHNDTSNIGTNYTMRRKMVNENALVEKLKLDGYVEIFTEQLTTIEKVQYFSNATHIIGAIGGGIANVVFSPKSTYLKAIISPTFLDINKRFKFCLDKVNVEYDMNTKHIEDTLLKTYMRVRVTSTGCQRLGLKLEHGLVGEIEQINGDIVYVLYTIDCTNTGWNAQNIYNRIELRTSDVENIDNGLNSPWTYCP